MFQIINATCLAAGVIAGTATYLIMTVISKLVTMQAERSKKPL